jgi:hypothetical protein
MKAAWFFGCPSVALAVVVIASTGMTAQTPVPETELARSVLEKVSASRQKVTNFRCLVRYDDFRPNGDAYLAREAKKRGIEAPKVAGHTFQEDKVAFDNKGCGRVEEMVGGTLSSDDSQATVQSRSISTWDGKTAIDYGKRSDMNYGYAYLGNEARSLTNPRHRQPWSMFGGDFAEFYRKALEQGQEIDIRTEKDGTYRVVIPTSGKNLSEVGIVDPAQGYSVTVHETYRSRHLVDRFTATFSEVSPGIWFPVKGESLLFDPENPDQVRLHSTVAISNITINDPNFYDGLYHVDFPEGTRVTDMRLGRD